MQQAKWVPVNAGVLSAPPMDPWRDVWTRPRETVRHLVREGADGRILAIAALCGIGAVLNQASRRNVADFVNMSDIMMLALLVGPAIGALTLYAGAWLTAWTGRFLGGDASPEPLRIALAWSAVPNAVAAALWLLAALLMGRDLFSSAAPGLVSPLLVLPLLVFGLVLMVLGVWSLYLMAQAVTEVQGYASAWRGLGNVILASLLVIVAVMLLGFVLIVGFLGRFV